MKLMVSRGSRACSISAMAPSAVGSSCYPPGWLPQILSKVASSNQSFYQKLKALALIGLVAMVPMVISS